MLSRRPFSVIRKSYCIINPLTGQIPFLLQGRNTCNAGNKAEFTDHLLFIRYQRQMRLVRPNWALS